MQNLLEEITGNNEELINSILRREEKEIQNRYQQNEKINDNLVSVGKGSHFYIHFVNYKIIKSGFDLMINSEDSNKDFPFVVKKYFPKHFDRVFKNQKQAVENQEELRAKGVKAKNICDDISKVLKSLKLWIDTSIYCMTSLEFETILGGCELSVREKEQFYLNWDEKRIWDYWLTPKVIKALQNIDILNLMKVKEALVNKYSQELDLRKTLSQKHCNNDFVEFIIRNNSEDEVIFEMIDWLLKYLDHFRGFIGNNKIKSFLAGRMDLDNEEACVRSFCRIVERLKNKQLLHVLKAELFQASPSLLPCTYQKHLEECKREFSNLKKKFIDEYEVHLSKPIWDAMDEILD